MPMSFAGSQPQMFPSPQLSNTVAGISSNPFTVMQSKSTAEQESSLFKNKYVFKVAQEGTASIGSRISGMLQHNK